MQILTISTASADSAQALCRALAEFHPDLATNEPDAHVVSLQLGSDRRLMELLPRLRLAIGLPLVPLTPEPPGTRPSLQGRANRRPPLGRRGYFGARTFARGR